MKGKIEMSRKKKLLVILGLLAFAGLAWFLLAPGKETPLEETVSQDLDPSSKTASAPELPQENNVVGSAPGSSTSFIDVPYMALGQLASAYARRSGYVLCDDLLNDVRPVQVKLDYDNPTYLEAILQAYGYRTYSDRGITFWCGSSDPFGLTKFDFVKADSTGIWVKAKSPTETYFVELAKLAQDRNLKLTYQECAYVLSSGAGPIRHVYNPGCVSNMGLDRSGSSSGGSMGDLDGGLRVSGGTSPAASQGPSKAEIRQMIADERRERAQTAAQRRDYEARARSGT